MNVKYDFLFLVQTYVLASSLSPARALGIAATAIKVCPSCLRKNFLQNQAESFVQELSQKESLPDWVVFSPEVAQDE